MRRQVDGGYLDANQTAFTPECGERIGTADWMRVHPAWVSM